MAEEININKDALQEALDQLAHGFGSFLNILDTSGKTAEEFQYKKQKQDDEQLKRVKKVNEGFDDLTKAQQDNILAYDTQLQRLQKQNESIQVLTREQNAAIEAQQKANKQKQAEADSTKHQGNAINNAFGQMSSASGILSTAQKSVTERLGETALSAGIINLGFMGLDMMTKSLTLSFDQYLQKIDQTFQNQLEYNNAVALGADGMKKANLIQSKELGQEAARRKQEYELSVSNAKQMGMLTLGLGGLAVASTFTGRAIMGITGPVGILLTVLTAIGTWWFGEKAKQEKKSEQELELAKQTLDQQSELRDKLYNTYMDIGKAGMVGAEGMTALTENAHKAGFAIKDIEKFTSVLKENQKEMSLFAGGAAAGVDKFSSVTAVMAKDLGEHFRNMGISVEEQANETAKYMALQSRLGLLQGKTINELAAGAGKYLEELDKTATLLGTSRKEQEDARKAVMAIQQLRAAQMIAESNNDKEESARLGRYADLSASLLSKGLTKEGVGVAKLGASGGGVNDSDTIIARQVFSNELFNKLDKNIGTPISRLVQSSSEVQSAYLRSAPALARTNSNTGMVGGTFDKASDFIKDVQNQEAAAREANAKGLKEGSPEYIKFFDEFLTKQKVATDPLTVKTNQIMIKQAQDSMLSDKNLLKGINTFDLGANKFSNAVDKFADAKGGVTSGKDIDREVKRLQLQSNMTRKDGTTSNPYAQNKPGGSTVSGPSGPVTAKPVLGEPMSNGKRATQADILKWEGESAKIKSTSAPAMQSGGSVISSNNAQLKDAGLRIKTGDVQKEGSKIDPQLLEIAKQAQANIPGFMYFSGFNDQYHQENSPSSQHTKGLAFDFTVNPGRGKSKPSKEDSEQIIKMLKDMGITSVTNEYDKPSAKATGGHFHAELAMPGAYDGGLFDGPKSGYPVELHGREAIVPMPDPSAKIKIESNSPDKEALSSVVSNTNNSVSESATNTRTNDMIAELMEMMTVKMDDMIGKLDQGNTYSDKLVKAMA